MAVALYGNNGYKKSVNITVDASQTLKPVRALMGSNQLVDLSVTGGVAGNAVTPVDLTSSQIIQAAKDPMGLQLGNQGGVYNITPGGGASATAALALALQQLLGIDAAVGHGKFLRFFWLDRPAANIALQATSTPVAINTLQSTGVILCNFTPLAAGVSYNKAEIYITNTSITAGAQSVLITITEQGGSSV